MLTYPTVPKTIIEDVNPELEMYPKLPRPIVVEFRDCVEIKL